MSFLTAFTPIDPNSWVALYYLRWLPFLAATVRVDLLLATPDCVFPPTPTTPYTAPSPVDTTCLAVALVFICLLIMVLSGLVLCGVRFKLPQLVQRLGGYTLIVCLAEALIFVLLLNTIQNIYKYTAHSLYRLSVAFLDKVCLICSSHLNRTYAYVLGLRVHRGIGSGVDRGHGCSNGSSPSGRFGTIYS
ncbi:hypothetical protein QCA50_020089 [Cerrena zonata]|uniref:Uncharacterized protein n=1 Tax=Cerrena zonata TaxID=2478898 RepID=A0AAW0FA47_9APHY